MSRFRHTLALRLGHLVRGDLRHQRHGAHAVRLSAAGARARGARSPGHRHAPDALCHALRARRAARADACHRRGCRRRAARADARPRPRRRRPSSSTSPSRGDWSAWDALAARSAGDTALRLDHGFRAPPTRVLEVGTVTLGDDIAIQVGRTSHVRVRSCSSTFAPARVRIRRRARADRHRRRRAHHLRGSGAAALARSHRARHRPDRTLRRPRRR